ncbi:MAG: GNAT family N-acetyltransferase [Proteobacteria bacterium]|nr:GNAT family N-acetyltransferase [Pseudomonadota bacterium]
MSTLAGISCVVTGFSGHEGEILKLRNSNRENPETLDYLRWRYEPAAGAPAPCVYWLKAADGQVIGMAAAVFRPYTVDSRATYVAVIGDISLDNRYRRMGLGQQLLRAMTEHLDQRDPGAYGLVIPTDSARRSLDKVGWVTGGALGSLVYLLDAEAHVRRLLHFRPLSVLAARGLRACMQLLARRHTRPGGVLRLNPAPDAHTYAFLESLPHGSGVQRRFPPGSLEWRYVRHPHSRFTFATYNRDGAVRGLLVFEDTSLEGTCSVYDLFAAEPADLRAMLAQFILRSAAVPGIATIRVALDEAHPARESLRRLGFIARPAEAVFQVHSRDGNAQRARWRITQGDKDT